jgi:hypothetical protein
VSHDKASIALVPPPNFAKESDSRYGAYVEHFGTTDCWELDALPPTVITDLIRTEVTGLIRCFIKPHRPITLHRQGDT